MMLICASPSIVAHEADAPRAENAAVAVQHQRRSEVDVGLDALAVELAARKLHPALLGPERYEKSCSGHSPPLSHTGQSSGWLIEQELEDAGARRRRLPASACDTTMPSVQTVEHDVCSFGIFSILTMQTRQEPSMLMPG